MNANHQYYMIHRNIKASFNQLHLDACRRLISDWLLDKGQTVLANRLAGELQVREIELMTARYEIAE